MKGKLYFGINDEICSPIDHVIEDMHEEGITELRVNQAEREVGSEYFYCRAHGEVGEKGWCGSMCDQYSPRNGKSGICKYNNPVYSQGQEFILKLDEKGSYGYTLIKT